MDEKKGLKDERLGNVKKQKMIGLRTNSQGS